jgi:CBS domain containing-hemolysin-like protein
MTALAAIAIFASALGLLFFAIVEMAFTLLMRLPQRLEAERESEGDALEAYLDDPLKFFVPARLMRGTLVILFIVLLSQFVDDGWVGGMILFASGLGAAIGLGQFVPALIVRRSPERLLELLLPAFTAVANAISPLTVLIIGFLGSIERAAVRTSATGAPTALKSGESDVRPQADQNQLLRSVVDFGETLVREVMTPRPDIVAIQSEATIDDLRRLVQEQEYSRLPVYTDNLDNIVGLVVVKDLIQRPDTNGGRKVADIMRPASFVPETKRVMDLLREFRQKRVQLAIVVDEYGGTAGLVTVEDVVEELVGEIRDEYDSEAEPIVREGEDTYVFSAKVAFPDMLDRLGREIEAGEFETVGGYVLSRVGRVPGVGERFTFDDLDIEILEAERRRIHKVRVRRLPQPATEVAG